jgi:xylulokinase
VTYVAGVDSSTQSCKLVIRDLATGSLVRTGLATHPGGTEVAPSAWWDALLAAIDSSGGPEDVSAVSIAAQQHGMVVLDTDRTCHPSGPVVERRTERHRRPST